MNLGRLLWWWQKWWNKYSFFSGNGNKVGRWKIRTTKFPGSGKMHFRKFFPGLAGPNSTPPSNTGVPNLLASPSPQTSITSPHWYNCTQKTTTWIPLASPWFTECYFLHMFLVIEMTKIFQFRFVGSRHQMIKPWSLLFITFHLKNCKSQKWFDSRLILCENLAIAQRLKSWKPLLCSSNFLIVFQKIS